MSLSGLKDIDREIFKYVEDAELVHIWKIDKKTYYETCDDNFLRRRIGKHAATFKGEEETWKRFFLRLTYYVSRMQKEYEFEYIEGNFEKQYEILKREYKPNRILEYAIEIGSLSLVKHAVEKGGEDDEEGESLFHASQKGFLEIAKWLIENDFSRRYAPNTCTKTINSKALTYTCNRGHIEIIRYLLQQDVDIHIWSEAPLHRAICYGYFEVVKLLISAGADIHAENDRAFRLANECNQFEILRYLESLKRVENRRIEESRKS